MLQHELERSVFGQSWHGPSLMEAMEEVSADAAYQRPIVSGHTIGEIVLHVAAWMEEVLSRIDGVRHAEPAAGDWAACTDWDGAVHRLESVARALVARVGSLTPADLERRVGDTYNAAEATGFTLAETISGVAQHNTYHAGQIVLLSRLIAAL